MWKDQDLHKLFRSRLPVADLPAAFADRLTHTILAEVALLRETIPLPNASATEMRNEATPFAPAPQPTTRRSVRCTL